MTNARTPSQNILRTVALIVFSIGAIGSLYFMFKAGQNQKSILLIALFTGWVLSPFVGLLIVKKKYRHWKVSAHSIIYWLMIVLAIVSLVAYSGTFSTTETKPAFIFLVVPLTSWFLILTMFIVAKQKSKN